MKDRSVTPFLERLRREHVGHFFADIAKSQKNGGRLIGSCSTAKCIRLVADTAEAGIVTGRVIEFAQFGRGTLERARPANQPHP
jgi:hypothetical protein